MTTGLKYFFSLLIALAIAAGIWTACQRFNIEDIDRQVEIAVDSRLLSRDDFDGGNPGAAQLRELGAAGCTALAVNPLTLNELEKKGLVTLIDTAEIRKLQAFGIPGKSGNASKELPRGLYISAKGRNTYENLHLGLSPLLGDLLFPVGENIPVQDSGFSENHTFFVPERYAQSLRELPLFLPQEQMTYWSSEGFKIVPLFNYPSRFPLALSEKYWEALSLQIDKLPENVRANLGPIAFTAAAFSFPSPQGRAAEIFRNRGFTLGLVEFTQGNGLKEMAKTLDYRVLRTHQISTAELGQLGEDRSIERFIRAVQERKVRALLLYPFPELDPRGEFGPYLGFIEKLKNKLEKSGFLPGEALPAGPISIPAVLQSLFSTGIVAAALLLTAFFIFKTETPAQGMKKNEASAKGNEPGCKRETAHIVRRHRAREAQKKELFLGISVVLILAAVVLPFFNWGPFFSAGFFQKIAALVASLVFPVLGVIIFLEPLLRKKWDNEKGYLPLLIKNFLLATLLTTGGALVAAGMLGETAYLLKIDNFLGVKISLLAPFVILGLYIMLQDRENKKENPTKKIKEMLELQIKVKHLLLLFLGGGVLLLYLIRGGNFPALPVSQWELAFRRYLEVLLVARPRFKEFLIGHPGFFLFAALAFARIRGSGTLALLTVLVGQISLFNTFMHLHRPVSLSLLGTGYGAGLGIILGLILYLLARWAVSARRQVF